MATTFATLTNSAPQLPLDFPFPLPAAPHCDFKLVPKATSMKPISAGAFNLQYLLDNFTPEKSHRAYHPIHRA